MPAKNTIKIYIENGHYHIYNRGVEKRNIFMDDQDYNVFLFFIKNYLTPLQMDTVHPVLEVTGSGPVRIRPLKNFSNEIKLFCHCLMPNHFHLLLKQSNRDSMSHFIQALCTSYTMYFNKKYQRVGCLFQGVYKASLILEDNYLLHLSRYIHLNPLGLMTGSDPVKIGAYPYSSYDYYLRKKTAQWINPEPLLSFFESPIISKNFTSYQNFVEEHTEDPREIIGALSID